MTEDEAKTKWCPFGRTPHFARDLDLSGVVAANRAEQTFEQDALGIPAQPLGSTQCIASACMAWRWNVEAYEAAVAAFEDSKGIGGLNTREEPVLGGRCGLAGAS